jgi:ribosome-binding ATPase YchF (GTP1/OBG family)
MHVNDPSNHLDDNIHKKNSIIDPEKKEVINIEDLQENLVQKDMKILKEELEKVSNRKYKSSTWNKEVYFQLIENDIDQYSEQKEPLEREDGNWVEPNEFYQTFDNFIILYNPSEYLYKFEWDNLWYDTKDSLKIIEENDKVSE